MWKVLTKLSSHLGAPEELDTGAEGTLVKLLMHIHWAFWSIMIRLAHQSGHAHIFRCGNKLVFRLCSFELPRRYIEMETAIIPVTPITPTDNNDLVSSEVQPNKRRRKKSIVWDHFTVETVGDGCIRACCNQCKKSFAYITGSKLAGTSHLKRHIALGICPFIDMEWNLHRCLLNVVMVPSPDSDCALQQAVVSCLSDWQLENRLFTLGFDQFFSNVNINQNLRALFSVRNPYMLHGQFLIGNCFARIISLLAQEALWSVGETVKKIRDSVKFVKTSDTHEETFFGLKEQLKVPSMKDIFIDDQTKWNTTYDMLAAACELKQVFLCLETSIPDYNLAPSMDDWKQIEILCTYLKLFFDALYLEYIAQALPPPETFVEERNGSIIPEQNGGVILKTEPPEDGYLHEEGYLQEEQTHEAAPQEVSHHEVAHQEDPHHDVAHREVSDQEVVSQGVTHQEEASQEDWLQYGGPSQSCEANVKMEF
ncbi:Putative AC transposase [Gossypium arboreum]|uniref:Putative AC transposase n=1 Tax=Gossypium arboreum TaxID=29729 RepID=A0A0B0N3I8_GOSAR|nr:Putative AC transposase [Gossypium arboreum]